MSPEQISVPLLLIGAIIIAIGALIFGKIIVKSNIFFLIGEIGEILSNPLHSAKDIWRFIIQLDVQVRIC